VVWVAKSLLRASNVSAGFVTKRRDGQKAVPSFRLTQNPQEIRRLRYSLTIALSQRMEELS